MTGPNARYALADDDRAPADRRAPELELPAGDAAARPSGRRRLTTPQASASLGLQLPLILEAVDDEIGKLERFCAELRDTRRELDTALAERARHVASSACDRIVVRAQLAGKLIMHMPLRAGGAPPLSPQHQETDQ